MSSQTKRSTRQSGGDNLQTLSDGISSTSSVEVNSQQAVGASSTSTATANATTQEPVTPISVESTQGGPPSTSTPVANDPSRNLSDQGVFTMNANMNAVVLRNLADHDMVRKFFTFVRACYPTGPPAKGAWDKWVDQDAQVMFEIAVISASRSKDMVMPSAKWQDWPLSTVERLIAIVFPSATTAAGTEAAAKIEAIPMADFQLSSAEVDRCTRFVATCNEIFTEHRRQEVALELRDPAYISTVPGLLQQLYRRLRRVKGNGTVESLVGDIEREKALPGSTIFTDHRQFMGFLTYRLGNYRQVEERYNILHKNDRKGQDTFTSSRKRSSPEKGERPTKHARGVCNHCGRDNHMTERCFFQRDKVPGINPDAKIPYKESAQGRANGGKPFSRPTSSPTPRRYVGATTKCTERAVDEEAHITFATPTTPVMQYPVLIDSGCAGANYGSRAVGEELQAAGFARKDSKDTMCSIFGECKKAIGTFNIPMVELCCYGTVIKITDFNIQIFDLEYHNLIIGIETIKRFNISLSQASRPCSPRGTVTSQVARGGSKQNRRIQEEHTSRTEESQPILSTDNPGDVHAYIRESRDVYLSGVSDPVDDDEFGPSGAYDVDLVSTPAIGPADSWIDDVARIEGSAHQKTLIQTLLASFADVFSKTLPIEASTIPAYEIPVREDFQRIWERPAQRQQQRPQSVVKQTEMARQIRIMLDADIISKCRAAYWSHALLALKKNGKWRFCVDFRTLNSASKDTGWPIPMIGPMLRSIGAAKPRHFGVLDLTQGYHQIMVAKQSRHLTAFVTSEGLYQFNRVPFGLKGSPAYFQYHMTVILGDLVGQICQVYMDDIIIFGHTFDEWLQNLRSVLERLRRANLVANPEKTLLNVSEIEYVGHVLNDTGLHFTPQKLESVLKFPKPTTQKQVRAFLGLANYFRDHVRNYASLAAPLARLTSNKKQRVIKWTDETSTAFDQVREAIGSCPATHFVDEERELFLHTDACDYGVGAWLYQYIEEGNPSKQMQRPIAFCSKALSAQQIKAWSTFDKEAYAIVFGVKKFEHYLRDKHFILRTDHRNLTFIEKQTGTRVYHWKLWLQQFSFDIEHIAGADNVIADHLSRDLENIPAQIEATSLTGTPPGIVAAMRRVSPDRIQLFDSVHNEIAGHLGVDRTVQRLRTAGKRWRGMTSDVRSLIQSCPVCQKQSQLPNRVTTEKFTLSASSPMEIIHLDSIGPLPVDVEGNQFILVIIDAFSRFIELYPLRDLTARPAATAILTFMGRYGLPLRVHTDGATQFKEAFDLVLKQLRREVQHSEILAYSHQENAIVERANKEVLRHLRTILLEQPNVKDNWRDALPMVQRIMNSMVHSSTGMAPATIIFGSAINLDRNLFSSPGAAITPQFAGITDSVTWVQKLSQLQQEIINTAQKIQRQVNEDHLHPPAKKPRTTRVSKEMSTEPTTFAEGSFVLVEYPEGPFGKRASDKLMCSLKGPYQVLSHDGPHYSIRNLVTLRDEKVFVGRLRPFVYDPNRVVPREVALRELRLHDVEEIISHRGDLNGKKGQLEFRVKWLDQSMSKTWEPWANVYRTQALHAYLKKIKRPGLIPRAFRIAQQESN